MCHVPRSRHPVRLLAVLSLVLVSLAACAPTLLYRHADRLVVWKVDDYFDLTADQKRVLRDRLKQTLARHRREALPAYERFLIEIKQRSADGITREELDWAFATYEELRKDLFARLVDDAASFLLSVKDSQVAYVEQVFRKERQRSEALLLIAADIRLDKRAAATVDWLKDWLGPLSQEQKQRIRELSRGLPDLLPLRATFQAERQHELVRLLRQSPDRAMLVQRLSDWWVDPARSEPPDYQSALQQMRQAIKDMTLSIDATLTGQQRAHALWKLQQLIEDVHGLAATS
ncbi:DUF6279 family lipoprotein [Candidatus Nitrospira bockiana]